MSPHENVIVGNSFEEIVFTNRNKEYGAFMLRKKQKQYQILAFFIAFLMVTSSAVTPLIHNYLKGHQSGQNEVSTFTVAELDTTLKFTPPEAPKLEVEPMANKFVPPLVVEKVDSTMPEFGSMDALLAAAVPTEIPTNIVPIEDTDPVIIVEDKPFITVEIPAEFEGGDIKNFNRWVLSNIRYPDIAAQNGITGKVYIQFVVNSKGKVENVTVLRGADPALNDEAVRVIESSPKWSPPLQGGKPVKQLFSMPVHFKLDQ